MTSNDPEPSHNDYLAFRDAKIKRNEARLRELGLLKKPIERPVSTLSKSTASTIKRKVAPSIPTRRSSRLTTQPATINYKESNDDDVDRKVSTKRPRVVQSSNEESVNETTDQATKTPALPVTDMITYSSTTVRLVRLCTQRLVFGSSLTNREFPLASPGVLGIPMDKPGKEFVINKSFEIAAPSDDKERLEGERLSFNKYCGIQEWQNCAFLWVNLGAPGNTVENEFLDGGKKITWFGGSRMDEWSPVMQKLLGWGLSARSSDLAQLVLWCRRYDKNQKKFLPYVCLGRLSYHSHIAESYPVSVVWNLLDSERLRKNENPLVRESFQQILNA